MRTLAFLVLVAAAAASPSPRIVRVRDECPRLPNHALPFAYQLEIHPKFGDNTFKATAYIAVRTDLYGIIDDVTSFVVHAEGLDVTYSNVYVPSTSAESVESMIRNAREVREEGSRMDSYDAETHFLTLDTKTELKHGWNYLLVVEYDGKIRDDMVGFYKASYTNGNGVERDVFATQFQPTHARKTFPCFDEPYFKANFTLVISIPSGYDDYHALSNMPVKVITPRADGGRDFTFFPSLPMSSYLVAWVVSDYVSKDDGSNNANNGVSIRAWAPSNSLQWTQYALEVTRPALSALERYTGIPYKYPHHQPQVLDKIDQVVIPEFMFGAMENWGLITYRDNALLYSNGTASARQGVLSTISHELVHMWFGNLVTTAQWDYAWLNEGFAGFLETYIAGSAVEDTWRLREMFVVNELHRALELDGHKTSLPLTRRACTPADATEAFQSLTYHKGASVLRMINYVLGPENFQNAIKNYLTKNSFKPVTPTELFSELKEYSESTGLSKIEMETFLRSWTEDSGYPFVFIIRDYKTNSAYILQRRYLYTPEMIYFPTHFVPLTWTHQGGSFEFQKPKMYLSSVDTTLTFDENIDNNKWVIFNVQQTGYYRTMYDYDNYGLLIKHLNGEQNDLDDIHVINRAQLIDDACAFGRSGQMRYTILLYLLNYLKRETEYVPWAAAFSCFSFLDRMLMHEEEYHLFKKHILGLVSPQYERFNFSVPEDHNEKLIVNRISSWACAMGNTHCINSAVTVFRNYMELGETVASDLRSTVYCYGIQHTRDEFWDSFWDMYTTSRDETEKRLILRGLSCSNSEEHLKQLLQFSIDAKHINKQEGSYVFSVVYANPLGVDIALDFLDDNFDEILSYYGALNAISRIVNGIAERLTTQQQMTKLVDFVNNHKDDLGNAVDSATATVQGNIVWVTFLAPDVFAALREGDFYRLPTNVIPEQYELRLELDLDQDTYDGVVDIHFLLQEKTENILIHVEDLTVAKEHVELFQEISSTEPNDVQSTELLPITLSYVEDIPHRNLMRIIPVNELQQGVKYQVKIPYSGILRNDMVGFYKTFYSDDRGRLRKIAATKFAPVHARKAFPCFDEPSFKARFRLSLVMPPSHPEYNCLANADIESATVLSDGSREILFRNTPKMSTYIVAWVVSDLESRSDPDNESNAVALKTWARKNAIDWTAYSLRVTRRMLQFLEQFTNYPYLDETDDYPLNKIDQVGTPDFVSGAMENWGLITYRETALLYNDGAAAALKRAATVIAHELAHMWFGNLITTAWWSSTWLNEGFANYFQHLVTDQVERMWLIMDQFVVDHLHFALGLDSDINAKALTHNVVTPQEAIASFGSLTYSKGGAFLRMLSFVIGENNFKTALQNYVKNNAYKSATPNDLFVEIVPFASHAALGSEDMSDFLLSWTEQPGYPIVHVERHYDGSGRVTISQERFLTGSEVSAPQLYTVPLSWRHQNEIFDTPKLEGFLFKNETSKSLSGFKEDGWLVFNTQQMGYYRISYDAENWERLTAFLDGPRFDSVHWLNRAQLLDDAFALARAGRLSFARLLALTKYLPREDDYTPWYAALAGFAAFDRLLVAHQLYPVFQEYVLQLLNERYSLIGFGETDLQTMQLLVTAITNRACAMGHVGCRLRAAQLLHDHLYSVSTVAADVRSTVYCHGVRHASLLGAAVDEADVWERLWDRFFDSHDEAERALLLTGLGCSANAHHLRTFLSRTVGGEGVRKQEGASAFAAVYATPLGADVVLNFLSANMSQTKNFLGSVNSVISGLAQRLTTRNQRNKFADLVTQHSLGSAGTAALQVVDQNLKWIDTYADELMSEIKAEISTTTPAVTDPPSTTSPAVTDPPSTTPPSVTTFPTDSTTAGVSSFRVSVPLNFVILTTVFTFLQY